MLTGAGKDNRLDSDIKMLQHEIIFRLEKLTSSYVRGIPIVEQNLWISTF